ncbi:transposase [Symmachiella dynata]|uniref:transposase n=1 Tax=Symmachiella dynata TaxID=2527995 RepID=UPI003B84516E
MGAPQQCTLERFTKLFSLFFNLLAAVPRLDRGGYFQSRLGATAGRTRRSGRDQLGGSDGRWHVFPSKKRGAEVGKTKRGKGTKIMLLIDGEGLPLGVDNELASAAEANLIERMIDCRVSRRQPTRLIYDNAGDSDPLRERLAARGVDLISPHRHNRKRRPTQDGRKLPRYKRRYKVERTIAWLQYFRRLVIRNEYHAHLFKGFAQPVCVFTASQVFVSCSTSSKKK